MERIGTAIEEEAVLGVHREGAQTHAGGDFVHHGAVAAQADDTGVEIGVLHAVPEVGSVEVELSVCALSLATMLPAASCSSTETVPRLPR